LGVCTEGARAMAGHYGELQDLYDKSEESDYYFNNLINSDFVIKLAYLCDVIKKT